ncbi:DUF4105 domain-containing protein [Acinetobacter sp. A3.8]|uniref:DUF4105 domain-containing protein n=1 Tax=Acinetobacter sedimenti TaxID=2919922 RepID=A0A9X2B869_9GAMM|nr:DUF4105 domain-containing protein [Acinetobacter sedimenti]MCJ8145794.1 DUF4105 domain-containing protein [Acinetobacter sedimenti]
MNDIDFDKFRKSIFFALLHSFFYLFVILSSAWLCLALWIHQPFGRLAIYFIIGFWLLLSGSIAGIYFSQAVFQRRTDILIYLVCFSMALAWYFDMQPRNDRVWNPEVAKILDYQRDGDQITIHNVRDFVWRSEDDYNVRWQTRQYDLSQLKSANLILSYWAGNDIAHTLMSFDFEDDTGNLKHLTFSIEIRKEQHESFSSIGGFFRKYELAIVPADEKDIIYTRSNIRHERVYIYPINNLPKAELKQLFLSYLEQGKSLATEPRWYNTLFSNCTTIIFDMVNHIDPVPVDYRVILSGRLPSYLYDQNALDHRYSLVEWMNMAHINPKVEHFEQGKDQSSANFSRMIRSGLPKGD